MWGGLIQNVRQGVNEGTERNELLEEFVCALPKMRKYIGISQTELGEKVGLSRQTISLIERKSMPITWNNYLAIMMFFVMNSDDFYYFPRKRGLKGFEELREILNIKNTK